MTDQPHKPGTPGDLDGSDRRRYPRFTIKAFGLNHVSSIRFNGTDREAFIVDISSGGARMRLRDGNPGPSAGQKLTLDTRFKGLPREEAQRTGVVRWQSEREFGMAFDQELPFGVSDLQRLLDS